MEATPQVEDHGDDTSKVRWCAEFDMTGSKEERTVAGVRQIRDPWHNRLQAIAYRREQFSKTANVLAALNVAGDKTQEAQRRLHAKGLLITDRA